VSTEFPRLVADRFELRLAEAADVPRLLSYRRENADFFEPFEAVRSADHFTEAYWSRQVAIDGEQFEAGHAVRLYLFGPGLAARVLGVASFSNIIRGPFQSCFMGYALAESEQGKGLMTEALRLGIDYMFGEMNLHRISANYLPHNTRSAAVLRRLGFTVDGYARDYLLIEGRWQDHILTSLVNPDWRPGAG
jgi:ribosomal-protein-alanine N-acetyltransferase